MFFLLTTMQNLKNKKISWLKDIKYLVWDVDGTFYDFKKAKKYENQFQKLFFKGLQEVWGMSLAEAKQRFWQRHKSLNGFSVTLRSFGIDPPEFNSLKVYSRLDLENLMPKAARLNRELKKISLKQGIMSNNDKKTLIRKLTSLGIDQTTFSFILSSFDYNIFKPDIKIFQIMLKQTKVPASKVLYIGDSVTKDILPPKSLGIRTCLVRGESQEADLCFPSPLNVVELFL